MAGGGNLAFPLTWRGMRIRFHMCKDRPMAKRKRTATRSPASPKHGFWWEHLTDHELMDVRLCDLGLSIEDSPLVARIEELYAELRERRLRIRPHFWLAHEWFAPDGVPGFAIPFFLAHPRLMRLEARQMLEVEGGSKTWCMQLLRHETGHTVETAYRLNRRARWRQAFGKSSKPYPDSYIPKPFSQRYVLHLDGWYAQSHPSEDFAETFAVWLRPSSAWRKRYKDWPALKKLQYTDELMGELAGKTPAVRNRERSNTLAEQKQTLGEFYAERKARYATNYPDFFDRDLRRVFPNGPERKGGLHAATVLRRVAPAVRRQVAAYTGQHAYAVDQLMKDLTARCRELGLRVHRPPDDIKLDVAILLTMQIINFHQSGGYRMML
jgi:hypothetical protein